MENNSKNIKSDMPFYYGAAAVLLIMACVCIILIFQNIFSGADRSGESLSGNSAVESIQEVKDTEEELKISHAGLESSDGKNVPEEKDLSAPVFRSKS